MKAVFKTTGRKEVVVKDNASDAAGEVIFREGDLGTEMYIIQDGVVNIIKHINGEAHLLSRLEKGDFFGEMAMLENVPRTADAVAVTEVRAVVINWARFDEMLRKNPEIAVRIIRKYSKRLREANSLLERLVGRPVDPDHVSMEATLVAPAEKAIRHRLVDLASGTPFFFTRGGDYCVLEEVGTVNGTYVNDQRIPTGTPVPIHHGDMLKIGLIAMKAVFD